MASGNWTSGHLIPDGAGQGEHGERRQLGVGLRQLHRGHTDADRGLLVEEAADVHGVASGREGEGVGAVGVGNGEVAGRGDTARRHLGRRVRANGKRPGFDGFDDGSRHRISGPRFRDDSRDRSIVVEDLGELNRGQAIHFAGAEVNVLARRAQIDRGRLEKNAISSGVRSGFALRIRAITPATQGVAADVPPKTP